MKQFIYLLSACFGLLLAQPARCQTAAADNKMAEVLYKGSKDANATTTAGNKNAPPTAGSKIVESVAFEIPTDQALDGVFEGRTPCFENDRQLRSGITPGCDHVKWRIIFFRNKATLKPAACIVVNDMSGFRQLRSTWKIIKGTKTDRAAVVYGIAYGRSGKFIYLLKGDENVLFFLDENGQLRTGNRDFSYTLNRVQLVWRRAVNDPTP